MCKKLWALIQHFNNFFEKNWENKLMYTVNSISIKKIYIFMGGFIIIIFYEFKLLEKLHISCNFLWCHVNISHLHNFVHISKSSCSGIHQGMVMTSINTSINLKLRKKREQEQWRRPRTCDDANDTIAYGNFEGYNDNFHNSL